MRLPDERSARLCVWNVRPVIFCRALINALNRFGSIDDHITEGSERPLTGAIDEDLFAAESSFEELIAHPQYREDIKFLAREDDLSTIFVLTLLSFEMVS